MFYLNIVLKTQINLVLLGFGNGRVVIILTFNSDDPSLNPAEVYNFSAGVCALKMAFLVVTGRQTPCH